MREQSNSARYKVTGMTCPGCEKRIEKKLLEIDGVSAAKADFSRGFIEITYIGKKIDRSLLSAKLSKMGYEVGEELSGAEGNVARRMTAREFAGAAVIIFALYTFAVRMPGFGAPPEVMNTAGFAALFMIGLATSLHCTVMCGGISLSQCLPGHSPEFGGPARSVAGYAPSIMYNAGRVVSYTVIGGIVGYAGSVISFSGHAKGIVAVISGVFMVIMGLNMTGAFPRVSRFVPKMPRMISRNAGGLTPGRPFYVGLLNGLMPCGPLQAMQLYALGTGSMLAGAGAMFFFSLGTVPLMFAVGAVSTHLGSRFTRSMTRIGAVLVVFLGFVMLSRGLALSGVVIPGVYAESGYAGASASEYKGESGPDVAVVKDGRQTVDSSLGSGAYPEITIQRGIPLIWNIKADASDINGCNATMIIPDLGIEKKLEPGDNIIEFTPEKSGVIAYSCWMGMITSRINVVDNISDSAAVSKAGAAPLSTGASTPSCCQVR